MSAALLQGARGSTEDIDIWFDRLDDERIAEAARRAGGFWIARMQPPVLAGMSDRLDVVLTVSALADFNSEYVNAVEETVDGVKLHVLPLERVLVSKRAAGRSKDEPGVRQIELAIMVRREMREEE